MYSLKLVLYCCSLRSQRGAVLVNSVYEIQDQKQLWIRFAQGFFKSKSAQKQVLSRCKRQKSSFSEGQGRNLACSLVDTRSVSHSII